MKKASGSSARGKRAAVNGRRTMRAIDFSDISEATNRQLKVMRRVGRPPLGSEARQLIAIRVDIAVLEAFRREARTRGVGYQTLIHDVLAAHVDKATA